MTQIKKLSDANLVIGDYVAYESVKNSSGGVIYQIIENVEPIPQSEIIRSKMVNSKRRTWKWKDPSIEKMLYWKMPARQDGVNGCYVIEQHSVNKRGYWDKNGKPVLVSAIKGYVRIKPIFDLFATQTGKNPKGKNGTCVVEYTMIPSVIKKLDIVTIGTKYVELGNLIRDIATLRDNTKE